MSSKLIRLSSVKWSEIAIKQAQRWQKNRGRRTVVKAAALFTRFLKLNC